MTQKRFVEMAKAVRLVDSRGRVDYDHIATMLCNYLYSCVRESRANGRIPSADAYLEDIKIIDSYQDNPLW